MADLFIDFETMGIDPTRCAVVNLSYVFFNRDRFNKAPYTFKELVDSAVTLKLDVKQQVKDFDYRVEADTLKFWRTLPDNVRAQAKPEALDLTVATAVGVFAEDIKRYEAEHSKVERWWSRGNNFDPVVLRRLFRDSQRNLDDVLDYSSMRDVRTYIDTRFDFSLEAKGTNFTEGLSLDGFEQHNSRHDLAADIMRMQTIERAMVAD